MSPTTKSSNAQALFALGIEELEERVLLSAIQIFAAGSTNDEQIQLQIDGDTVRTWNNLGGDADNGVFATLNYSTAADISADQVRVRFTNDLYEPQNGIDRNVRVDAIVIDGQRFEAEAPTVWSTGTWTPQDGVTPGFKQSEYLHTVGHFQFADTSSQGTTIEVRALGDEGVENFDLQINGSTVASYSVSTQYQIFSYQTSNTVSADQIRIVFTNDVWEPANNIDNNLNVDFIRIDGTTFQTEDISVFSTGTWKPSDGITPGFRQSEYLHTNGYFQYADTANDPGNISLQTSVINVNESSGSATLTVLRTQGSSGQVTVDYRTEAVTATAGQDYATRTGTFVFEDGETAKSINIPIFADSLVEGEETFAFTIDNVQGGATLLAPRTATITISDENLPNFDNFSNGNGLDLNGDAFLVTNRLRLTVGQDFKVGSAFFDSPLPVDSDTSFQTDFAFQLTAGNGTNGADGIAFVLQNHSAGSGSIGSSGSGIGYSGVLNSLAIEFDTFQNAGEISGNHVSVLRNGSVTSAIASANVSFDLNSPAIKYAWIDYNGFTDTLEVFISQANVKPNQALLSTNVALDSLVGSQAYVGFTGSTGGSNNIQDILSWHFTTAIPSGSDPPDPGDELVTEIIETGFVQPTAVEWSPDGSTLYVSEQRGLVKVISNGIRSNLIDLRDEVNGTRDRGLTDIELHPDLANNPYIYLLYTYDPPEVFNNSGHPLAGPDQNGNRAGRLERFTLDASTNYTTVNPNSGVVILGTNSTWNNFNGFVNSTVDFNEAPAGILPDGTNLRDFIASDSESHTVGSLAFGDDGSLYVSIGDGTSYNQADPRTVRVQDIDNLSGKVLRINPINGRGYSDNPFFNGDPDANRSKVYQLGLRNPFRIAFDSATDQLFVGDVGWTRWEEVNVGGPGANFGWPYYEGGSGNNIRTPNYQNLPEAQAFYASNEVATPSIFALNHAASGINAIILGDVYSGNTYPTEFQGNLFFNDLGQGIVRNISFNADGSIANVDVFTTDANLVVNIEQGPDGNLYFVNIGSGEVGRWTFQASGSGIASGIEDNSAPVNSLAFGQAASNLTVAVIDSGIDFTHTQLVGTRWLNVGEIAGDGIDNDGNGYIDDLHGYDFVDNDRFGQDEFGHGTFMAGLIGSANGIASGVSLMNLRVLDHAGNGDLGDVAAAIRYAVDNGAQIINLPIESGFNQDVFDAIVYAQENNVLIVAAAGNNSADTPSFVAALSADFDNVISAGALTAEGHRQVDSNLVGYSGAIQLDTYGTAFGLIPDEQYTTYRGTSVATAYLAGAAALVWTENDSLDASQVRDVLTETANPTASGSDSSGTLNVSAAVELAALSKRIDMRVVDGRLIVDSTTGDDRILLSANADSMVINGIRYQLPDSSQYSSMLIQGLSGSDRIFLTGTNGDDVGYIQPGLASLRGDGFDIVANGFDYATIYGQGGEDRLVVLDSQGDDQVTASTDLLSIETTSSYYGAHNFETTIVRGSQGTDSVEFIGSSADERLVGSIYLARMVNDNVFIEVTRFDDITARLGGGYDRAVISGSQGNDDFVVRSRSATIDAGATTFNVYNLERASFNGNLGDDTLAVFDSTGDDTFINRPLFSRLAGDGFDHRVSNVELVTAQSSSGSDTAVLHGSSGNDWIQVDPQVARMSNLVSTVDALNFAVVRVFGNGGVDTGDVNGSLEDDTLLLNSSLLKIWSNQYAISTFGFTTLNVDGRDGSDSLIYIDSAGDDLIELYEDHLNVISQYFVSMRNFESVQARSAVDEGNDVIRYEQTNLLYSFDAVGDWEFE